MSVKISFHSTSLLSSSLTNGCAGLEGRRSSIDESIDAVDQGRGSKGKVSLGSLTS